MAQPSDVLMTPFVMVRFDCAVGSGTSLAAPMVFLLNAAPYFRPVSGRRIGRRPRRHTALVAGDRPQNLGVE
jgi:hypothetical protein